MSAQIFFLSKVMQKRQTQLIIISYRYQFKIYILVLTMLLTLGVNHHKNFLVVLHQNYLDFIINRVFFPLTVLKVHVSNIYSKRVNSHFGP